MSMYFTKKNNNNKHISMYFAFLINSSFSPSKDLSLAHFCQCIEIVKIIV